MASAAPPPSCVGLSSRAEPCRQDSESLVSDELEFLGNVYLDEMTVHRRKETQLTFHLTPSTADDKDQQYVYLDLCLALPVAYPQAPPTMTFLQSRGLADAHLASIKEGVSRMVEELLGSPMVYEVVEWVRESLTQHNRPYDQCALCLCDFSNEETEFVKTSCYHYFHTSCLGRYIRYHQRQLATQDGGDGRDEEEEGKMLVCPVCREPIEDRMSLMGEREGPWLETGEEEDKFVFVPSQSLREWQSQMARLLQQQRERGGVIDLRDKDIVVDETWVMPPSDVQKPELPISKLPDVQSKSVSDSENKLNTRHCERYSGRGRWQRSGRGNGCGRSQRSGRSSEVRTKTNERRAELSSELEAESVGVASDKVGCLADERRKPLQTSHNGRGQWRERSAAAGASGGRGGRRRGGGGVRRGQGKHGSERETTKHVDA